MTYDHFGRKEEIFMREIYRIFFQQINRLVSQTQIWKVKSILIA